MFYTIYKITNILNGKYYIGKHQTKNLDDGYMGSGKILKLAIAKHGIGNFKKEILYIFKTELEMNNKEKELVIISEETYNLNTGGSGGFTYINSNPEIAAKKNKNLWYPPKLASIKWKEKYLNDEKFREQLKKISSQGGKKCKELFPKGTFFGKSHSEETKKKMSESRKNKSSGSKNSQWGSMWITNGIINKKIKKEDTIPENWIKGRII